MTTTKSFEWIVGRDPPPIQAHSRAKLQLIENYLTDYFTTVVRGFAIDRLHISLVDGFCGGGAFLAPDRTTLPGTPIILLKAVEAAERNLNKDRRKKLKIDAKFYFVDKETSAIEYLKSELVKLGHGNKIGESIHLITGRFEDKYKDIIEDIASRVRVGRSIFILDQCGYKDVPLHIARDILGLARSEIVLTFAVDWLINYISQNAAFYKAVAPVEISEDQIRRFIEEKQLPGGRYLIQRLLMRHIQIATGAPFFTPFFIRSWDAARDLWIVHLSKHPTARNVMTSSHWEIQNASIHQGAAGLNMLGFDPEWQDQLPLDFEFDGNAEAQIAGALQRELPYRIESLDGYGPITFDAFLREIANDTAARLDQVESALMGLHREKSVEILTPAGQLKRPNAKMVAGDRIQIAKQLIFPGIKLPK